MSAGVGARTVMYRRAFDNEEHKYTSSLRLSDSRAFQSESILSSIPELEFLLITGPN